MNFQFKNQTYFYIILILTSSACTTSTIQPDNTLNIPEGKLRVSYNLNDPSTHTDFFYNENKLLIEEKSYVEGTHLHTINYEYNERNLLVHEYLIDNINRGGILYEYYYKYNEDELLIEHEFLNDARIVYLTLLYDYDEDKRLSRKIYLPENQIEKYTYNSDSKLEKVIYLNSFGDLKSTEILEYSEDTVRHIVYNSEDKMSYPSYESIFDDHGKLVEEALIYHTKGRNITYQYFYDEEEKLFEKWIYTVFWYQSEPTTKIRYE